MNLHASRVVDLELPLHLIDDMFQVHAVYVEYEDPDDSFQDCCTLEIISGPKRPYEGVSVDDMLEQFDVHNIEEASRKLYDVRIGDMFDLPEDDVWFD